MAKRWVFKLQLKFSGQLLLHSSNLFLVGRVSLCPTHKPKQVSDSEKSFIKGLRGNKLFAQDSHLLWCPFSVYKEVT